MATATPSPTPNPDAMKYTLDVTLPDSFNVTSAEAAGPDASRADHLAAALTALGYDALWTVAWKELS